ncbi:SDR family oxidoreductase [Acidisoma silvae]|uniref:SDR family oxidoreductase n=1 Tax=Acidisoma silvae TaxID=2802396 RepID=A0A963YW18_9PROT|nr:SDR family oxidoreductase [Acidisoma silvae]MCB8877899.1 SDR family oxidoreductase [Acidisoma silvae]
MTNTILITGASTGIGRATAQLFQSKGWNVIATMRDPDKETDLAALERTLVARLDVEDIDSIRSAVESGTRQFGRIDALLNNAGYGAYGPLEATPLEKIRRQFDTNVIGLLATTKALLPQFREQRGGVIVNVSSVGGHVAFPLGTLYHGSKFAVEGLSEALHYELAPIGVRVKIIEPGRVKTDFGGRSLDFSNDRTLSEYQPIVQAFAGALGSNPDQGSSAQTVAEVIFNATTDGSDQLRYEATPDAVQLLGQRRAIDDASFFTGIRARFGLSGQ